MFDLNNVFLSGRLTRDPELKYIESGYAICNFSLAVNRGKKKDSEEEYPAYFFNCIAWGKTGENIQKFFSKGRKILISGQLEHQTWDDNGTKRSAVKVNVKSFQFMDSKKDDDPAESASSKSHKELQAEADYFKKIKQEQAEEKGKEEGFDFGAEDIGDEESIPF